MSNHYRPWRNQERELRRLKKIKAGMSPIARAGDGAPACPNSECGRKCICAEKWRDRE